MKAELRRAQAELRMNQAEWERSRAEAEQLQEKVEKSQGEIYRLKAKLENSQSEKENLQVRCRDDLADGNWVLMDTISFIRLIDKRTRMCVDDIDAIS